MQRDSKRNPKVFISSKILPGVIPREAAASEGSTIPFLFEERITVFERMEGLQAGMSSITKSLFKAFKYEYKVGSDICISFAAMSFKIVLFVANVEMLREYERNTALTLFGFFSKPSTLEASLSQIEFT